MYDPPEDPLGNLLEWMICGVLLFSLQSYATKAIKNAPFSSKEPYGLCVKETVSSPYTTEDFILNTGSSLEAGVLEFSSEDKLVDVTLIGMSHYADEQFYRRVIDLLGSSDIVLMEGMDPATTQYPNHPFYKYLTKISELDPGSFTGQNDALGGFLSSNQERITNADITIDELIGFDDTVTSRLYWLNRNISSTLFAGKSLSNISKDSLAEAFIGAFEKMDYSDYALICPRNEAIMKDLEAIYLSAQQSGEHLDVAIPWGALHLPDMARRLSDMGFSLKDQYYLNIFSFGAE